MTDVVQHLTNLIRADGPITVAEFMRVALTARGDSYYRNRDPLGAAGDFVTAPEVSQIFGELIGLWCADVWRQLGAPKRFALVELGPGRGTLMKDALRAARIVPGFLESVSVVLVEVSEALKRVQRDTLSALPVRWRDRFDDIDDSQGPMIVVANEFFDALPVHQFVRTPGGWAERCVGLDASGKLVFGASPGGAHAVPETLRDAAVGSVVEIAPARAAVAQAVGERIGASGGAMLAIDYGFAGPAVGDTLQAVKAHAYVDVLAEPGAADLTSHVDFTALGGALSEGGARVLPLATQGNFLNALGAPARIAALKAKATAAQAADLDAALHRLTDAQAMGSLFNVLCAVAPASLQPAGFPAS
jgi:NADH dehydrogenase [ubiquinone] 1 alpha subcomplex assembly factor 7